MNSNTFLPILKYAILLIIFIVILKFVASDKISDIVLIIFAILFFIIFIIIEMTIKYFTEKEPCMKDCQNKCSISKEYMENIKSDQDNKHIWGKHVDNYTSQDMGENPDGSINIDPNFNNELYGVKRGSFGKKNINDVKYSDYNHVPIGSHINTGSYDKGYWYLPPSEWFPIPTFPPICVTQKHCMVQPTWTTGVPMDLKEWDDNARITPPDNINVDYIKNVLNTDATL